MLAVSSAELRRLPTRTKDVTQASGCWPYPKDNTRDGAIIASYAGGVDLVLSAMREVADEEPRLLWDGSSSVGL
jgi:hypothetical protein